jgi:hypothetical protein
MIMRAEEQMIPWKQLAPAVTVLDQACRNFDYEKVRATLLESVAIPPLLQHDTVITDHSTTLLTEIFALLDRKWQPFLGAFLIVGIYGWVFRTGREKRV